MLKVDDIHHRYSTSKGTVEALDGVSLEVGKGELVLVCGPSGCGKSTLLLSAGAMMKPTSGTVLFDEIDLYKLDITDRTSFRRDRSGFVFQLFHLLPYLDALDNVLVGTTSCSEDEQRARDLLETIGLGQRIHHRPEEMSIGERQRTALARALVNSPALLLADEPTGNLDPESAEGVRHAMVDYQSKGGTLVVVSHNRTEFAMADRIIQMRSGKIESTE